MQDVHVPNKVLHLHEPAVAAIPKGKRSKPNEYGSKVALFNDNNGFIVGHTEYPHNVADTSTLEEAVNQWEEALTQNQMNSVQIAVFTRLTSQKM